MHLRIRASNTSSGQTRIGVPIRVEDDKGKVAWSARISPYGHAETDPSKSVELALRFPGHYHDFETGLFYNRFRYYSPELGRYLQSDPIGIAGGINVYSYTSSPLTSVDLIGHNHPDQPDENDAPKGSTAAGANGEETDDNEPTVRMWAPPDPELAEAAGPLQKPWLIRDGEGTPPDSARQACPGSPMELDPNVSSRYMYVVLEDGTIVYAPQQINPDGSEAVKHTDLAQNGPSESQR